MRIKIKNGHKIDGEGESLGTDNTGKNHTFWRYYGTMDVPADLALALEQEKPQRFELVDKIHKTQLEVKSTDSLKSNTTTKVINPLTPTSIPPSFSDNVSLKDLKDMTKDELNDWGAKRDYDVNPRDTHKKIILKLVKQIFERTKIKIK